MILTVDRLPDLGANMSLTDMCGTAVIAQYYSRFHFQQQNTCVPFTLHFAFFYPQCNKILASCPRQYSFVRRCYIHSLSVFFDRMVLDILKVVGEYVPQVQGMLFVLPFSFGHGLYRDDGGPYKLFFMYLFCNKALAIRFLQDVTLIRSQVLCETCCRYI